MSVFETYGKLLIQKEILDNQISECRKQIQQELSVKEEQPEVSVEEEQPTGE